MYNENNMLNENERVNQPIDESAPVTEEPAAEPTTISDNAAQTHTVEFEPTDTQAGEPAAAQITMRELKKQGYRPYTDPNMSTEQPKKKKKSGIAKKIASAVALALIFGVVSGAVFLGVTGGFAKPDPTNPDAPITEQDGDRPQLQGSVSGQLQSATTAMQEALQKAQIAMQDTLTIPQINIIMEPAMVSINCIGQKTVNSIFGAQTYQTSSSGSGIIVGENETELLIVTNNHVIADTTEISVVFVDGQECKALVKGTDVLNDLAIIVVNLEDIPAESMSAIAYAEIGDSDALVIGEGVVAIGNALGFGQSVTQGIVSALNRAVTDSNGNTTYLIQTDAAINPGNSGGALVNMRGQVIGINSAKYSDEAVEGMCFAIPVNTAMPILEELMSRTTRVEITDPERAAYLGINYKDINAAMAEAYRMPVGVYVTAIGEGSPADKAGMLPGDVIVKFEHDTIVSYTDLRKSLSYYAAGETVSIVVKRAEGGQYVEKTLSVTLGVRPVEEAPAEPAPQQDVPSGSYGGDEFPSWFDFFGW